MMKNSLFTLFILLTLTACETKVKETNTSAMCEHEYEEYGEVVSKYKIRMENLLEKEGCEVIPIYASIIEAQEFDILDKVDDKPKMMNQLITLFSENEKFSSMVFDNSVVKKILLTNSLNDGFVEKFSYLVKKKLHKKEIRKIEKDTSYFNYTLLAALHGKDKKDAKQLYAELKGAISIELMPSFVLVYSAIGADYDFKLLVENFGTLQKKLSSDAVEGLAKYPKYFAYFLYPNRDDLGIGSISSASLREVQENMQEKVLYLYEEILDEYRYSFGVKEIDYALKTIEYIYPYLLEQHTIDKDKFRKLFHHIIKNGYILSLFNQDPCSQTSQEKFAVFGKGNIDNALKLLEYEKDFSYTLFSEFEDPDYSIMSFFYVANAYGNLNEEEWSIFKELLTSLEGEYDTKIAFIEKIEKSGYFRSIVQQSDYKIIIDGDHGEKNPKYKYVLLTPYPSQDDKTLYHTVLHTNLSDEVLQKSLVDLISKNKEQLETHEFTKLEKFFGNLDTLHNVSTVASIGLVPFTGGASLAYVATRVGTKVAAKKGMKYLAKKIALKSRRLVNKGVYQAREGRKVVDNTIGVEGRNKLGKNMNKFKDSIGSVNFGGKGIALFLASESVETETICEE